MKSNAPIQYFDIDEDYNLIKVCFASEYQIRLDRTSDDEMDWNEFLSYTYGLLSMNCAFGRIVDIRSTPSDKFSELSENEKKIWIEWRQKHPECVTHTKKLTLKDLYGEEL